MATGAISTSIIFGARGDKLDKDLTTIQRRLKRFGRNTARLGQDLTRNLTLPLAAFGAGAVKAFSDIETIEASFVSLTGSAANAKQTVKDLTDFTAKTPFRLEGVSAAARQLLAVGISGEELPLRLQQIGDAAAVSGKPIEDLAGVFAKTFAKGKAQTEELFQVIEAGVPITRILGEQFGKTEAEVLKMAEKGEITRDVFLDVFAAMNQEGGPAFRAMELRSETVAGKFSTLADAVQFAGAEMGKTIVESVDLKGIIDDLQETVQSFVKAFAGLPKETQNFLVKVGLLSAALGPVLKGFGGIVSISGGVINSFKKFRLGFEGLEGAARTARIRTLALRSALGLLVTGTAAFVQAFQERIRVIGETYRKQKELERLVAKQTLDFEASFSLDTENADLGSIEGAISTLENFRNKLNNLDEDGIKIFRERINGEQTNFISSIVDANLPPAVLKQFEKELQSFVDRASLVFDKQTGALNPFETLFVSNEAAVEGATKQLQAKLQEQLTSLKTARDSFFEDPDNAPAVAEDFFFPALSGDIDFSSTIFDERVEEQANRNRKAAEDLDAALYKLGISINTVQVGSLLSGLEAFQNTGTVINSTVGQVVENVQQMNAAVQNFALSTIESMGAALGATLVAGDGMGGAFNGIIVNLADLAIQIGKIAVSTGLAIEGIKKSLETLGPFAIPAGLALIAIGTAAKNALRNAGNGGGVTPFATGGIVQSPVVGLVGEAGPEAIIPLNRLSEFMQPTTVQVVGSIQGGNIFLSNERAAVALNRVRV